MIGYYTYIINTIRIHTNKNKYTNIIKERYETYVVALLQMM